MQVFAPGASPGFGHSGTFNGNPVTVAAGLKTLELLDAAAYEKLDRLGAMLADGLRAAIAETGAPAHVTHIGSLVNVHFTPEAPGECGGAPPAPTPRLPPRSTSAS